MLKQSYKLMTVTILSAVMLSIDAAASKPKPNITIPDLSVLDQNGKQINFYGGLIKNKTVAINFIFTTCTSSCPLSTAIFRQVQKRLGSHQVQLISISVDPTHDKPSDLLAYSKKFNIAPGWTFITGDKTTISEILKGLGAYTSNPNEHTSMVIVGNDFRQQWVRLFGLPRADAVIAELKKVDLPAQ